MKKLNKSWIFLIIALGILFFLSNSCKKDDNNSNKPSNEIKDIDGNVYHSVTIGNQIWMVENLKTTKFNDGSSITIAPDRDIWEDLSYFDPSPCYCWYNNDFSNKDKYGALYNFYAANNAKLAPLGWHVATMADWDILITFLGGDMVAGGKLKTGTGWNGGSGSNSSGFTAYPTGVRDDWYYQNDLGFEWEGYLTAFWIYGESKVFELTGDDNEIDIVGVDDYNGYSVRCIKD